MATVRVGGQVTSFPEKIQAIKLVREVTNRGLKEAKDFIEGLPGELEVGLYNTKSPQAVVIELNRFGYNAELVGEKTSMKQDVEQAFKDLLIALVQAGDYDSVILYIKTKKHGTVAGAANRNLEPM
jgi:hypothetical protein